MTTHKRCGKRWTISEIISLQREYELLEWTVQQIAAKHERSVRAILCKLEAEGFITSWVDARGFNSKKYQDICSGAIDEDDDEDYAEDCAADSDYEYYENDVDVDDEDDDDDEASEVDKLTERVWNLETTVNDIGTMVKQMFDNLVATKKTTKRKPLRQY